MKRKIFLVRHGESADKQTGQSDFDRSLTQRGKKSIELLGKFFKDEELSLEFAIASTAVRAKETVMILSTAIDFPTDEIQYDELLYNGSDDHYWQVVRHTNDTLLLVGHNPSISYVIGRITGDYSHSLQPGQCVIIEIDEHKTSRHSIKLIGPFHE